MVNQHNPIRTDHNPRRRTRRGFTLVDLLIVIAIIGILVALLLPAVLAARESARLTQCRNNLKQLSLGVLSHENTFRVLPSDGWGFEWIGQPELGVGVDQPGGWMYQILPFVERNDLYQIGYGLSGPMEYLALGQLAQTGMKLARCPTRPSTDLCPRNPQLIWVNAELTPTLSRSDYVGNAGDYFYGISDGPNSLSQAQDPSYVWPDPKPITGVLFVRSSIHMSDIVDGTTHTYLLGEKSVAIPFYASYGDVGYDQSIASGDDWDLVRWTNNPPHVDSQDVLSMQFGSAHASVCNMSLCDGSVRSISYFIDATVHRQLGNRNDGGPSTDDF